VASPNAEITIDCARFGGALWLGQSQFQRIASAVFEAGGKRLISEALAKLQAGGTLIWQHKPASFEKDSTVKLSQAGIHIHQTGVIFNKDVSIVWPHLKFTQKNGVSRFQNYQTREMAIIHTWQMYDNEIFLGLVGFLVDKANYRILES
jgi:hypothetical protein